MSQNRLPHKSSTYCSQRFALPCRDRACCFLGFLGSTCMRTKKRMRTLQREERTGAVSCFPLDMGDKNMGGSMSPIQTSVKWNIRNHHDNRLFSHRRKIE